MPASSILKPKFRVVVLDYEIVGVAGGTNEAVSIYTVDYLTGIVLINKLVYMTGKVISWRSGIHRIIKVVISTTITSGEALAG
jgi:hypothetical protein